MNDMIDLKDIKITEKHVFFWGSWLSNWYPAPFTLTDSLDNELTFRTSEQYFMWRKAMEFKDEETAKKILEAETPKEAKKLGRKVKGFDDSVWDKKKYDVMFTANVHKYHQNPPLAVWLIDHMFDNKQFVEASPYDKIWGIGMSMDAEGVDDEANWKGQNLLGRVLNSIRNNFLK